MRLVVAGVALELLDALTTLLIISFGLGREANPRLFFVNEEPLWLFPIFLAQAAFVGGVGYLAWLEKRRGYMRAYYVTASPVVAYLIHKSVVVVNNVAVGLFGFEGLDYYLSEFIKTSMVVGGLTYGIVRAVTLKNHYKALHDVQFKGEA
jgi:hypothetical protein